MGPRLIRTQYFAGRDYVRASASCTLEGAIMAAVRRLLTDSGLNVAYIYDQRFGEVSDDLAVTLRRDKTSVSVRWHTPSLFPRAAPPLQRRQEQAPATATRH